MPERFAIYYAPGRGSGLDWRAAQWLGRSPDKTASAQGEIPGIPAERLHELTRSARRYGFHATIKAPMRLAPGRNREQLEEALGAFARSTARVPMGRLKLTLLDGFLALVPEPQVEPLARFAAECVVAFEPFRAPLTREDRERRVSAGLTPRQLEYLDRYGYPYVLEEFQFHMTLTDRLPRAAAEQVVAAAQGWFGPPLASPVALDRLALFHEPEPGALFRRIGDYPLGTGAA